MTNHCKIYMKHFDYVTQEEIPCEACHRPAVDIHHIFGRGEGRDVVTNLMALCRKCHDHAHSKVTKSEMQMIHNYFLMGDRRKFFK